MNKKPSGGQAPYGYRWQEGSMELDPHEMPVRQYIYELFIQHKRKKAVARILNDEGYRTRRRVFFSGMTIGRILRDPIGKGLWRTGHTESKGKSLQWIEKEKSEWHYRQVSATVEEKVWQKCQDLLVSRGQMTLKKETRHLFRDFIVCHCGARMKVPSRKQKYLCPSCTNSIEKRKVEDVLKSQIHPFTIKEDDEKKRSQLNLNKRLLLHLANEATTIQTLLAHYAEARKEENSEDLAKQLAQIKVTIPKLEDAIQKLKYELTKNNNPISLQEYWPRLSFVEKRSIVEQIIKRVIVGEMKIKIVYSKAPYTIIH